MEFAATQAITWEDEDEVQESPTEHSKIQVATLKMLAYKDLEANVYPIYEGSNVIGRGPTCNIQILAASLSKEHATIEVEDGAHLICDLSSINRTRRGKLTLKPGVQYEIKEGDVIKFGEIVCHYSTILTDETSMDVSGIAADCVWKSDSESSDVGEDALVDDTPDVGQRQNQAKMVDDVDSAAAERIVLESDSDTDIELGNTLINQEKCDLSAENSTIKSSGENSTIKSIDERFSDGETQELPWELSHRQEEGKDADNQTAQLLKSAEEETIDYDLCNAETQPYPCFTSCLEVEEGVQVSEERRKSDNFALETAEGGDKTPQNVAEEVAETPPDISIDENQSKSSVEKDDDVTDDENQRKSEPQSKSNVEKDDDLTDDENQNKFELHRESNVEKEVEKDVDVTNVKDKNQSKYEPQSEVNLTKEVKTTGLNVTSLIETIENESVRRRGRSRKIIETVEDQNSNASDTPDSVEMAVRHLHEGSNKNESLGKILKTPVKRSKRKSTPRKVFIVADKDPVSSRRSKAVRKIVLDSSDDDDDDDDKLAKNILSPRKSQNLKQSPKTAASATPKSSMTLKSFTAVASQSPTTKMSTPKTRRGRKTAEKTPPISQEQPKVSTPVTRRNLRTKAKEVNSALSVTDCSTPKSRKRAPRSSSRSSNTESSIEDEEQSRSISSNSNSAKKRCLRQHETKNQPKITFTGMANTKKYENIVASLGGEVTSSVTDCTHLVTDKVRRTCKLLCILSLGCPIVFPNWLTACKEANRFVDEMDYLVKDAETEEKYEFELGVSLGRAAAHIRFLSDHLIHVTKSVKPPPAEMKTIIECAGGKFSSRMPAKKCKVGETVVVSCEEDTELCLKARQAGIPVVSSEFILTGVLRQKSQIALHKL
ncbi:Mediator of DNA damage checkpoint protein 1 [Chamberlinius hualienensis]